MRKYNQPAAHARRSAGITADYLEAVEAESDDGLTASDRARRSLLSRDRLDEQAEVGLIDKCAHTHSSSMTDTLLQQPAICTAARSVAQTHVVKSNKHLHLICQSVSLVCHAHCRHACCVLQHAVTP